MAENTEKATLTKSKRQPGRFLALTAAAFTGILALTAPGAVSKTIEKCADAKYDSGSLYDLKLSYSLGFTDTDIEIMQNAECVETVSTSPDLTEAASSDAAISTVSVYPQLFLRIKNAEKALPMSAEYNSIINDAREYIEINLEPSLSAARKQAVTSGLRKEIDTLRESLDTSEERSSELDKELASLDEEYDKALADMESEQESINKAKSVIQANEKNAQTKIEGGKKDLSGVLDEVYSKSVVTASDLKRAQGLSNYVSSSEKSMHNSFTSQWAELTSIETQLHEDQEALTEQKEKREKEIEEEKNRISQNRVDVSARISDLYAQLDENAGRWVIEDRSSIPEYNTLSMADKKMSGVYSHTGVFIYIICIIICIYLVMSIVIRNVSRINSWKERGLEDRIIVSLFIRRSGLAAAFGAIAGAVTGCIIVPIVYIYAYADTIGVPFAGLGGDWSRALAGCLLISTVSAVTSLITYSHNVKQ